MGWSVSTKGAQQIRELSARIKDAGDKGMMTKFRRNIRAAGDPCVQELRSAVMGVKVTRGDDDFARRTKKTGVAPRRSTTRWGPRITGLRARVAASIGVSQTKKGIRIRASAARIGPYGATLAKYLDGTLPGRGDWRHPVFGDRETWVSQKGSPWFFVTITKHRASFRKAVFAVLDETGEELKR